MSFTYTCGNLGGSADNELYENCHYTIYIKSNEIIPVNPQDFMNIDLKEREC